jgi:RNA polymerase sigma-70 factor (ECF subfamily)
MVQRMLGESRQHATEEEESPSPAAASSEASNASGDASSASVPCAPRAARIEPAAFAQLVDEYQTPLLRYLKRVASPEEVEDLAQEAFLRLHRQMTRDDAGEIRNIPAFLFRAAHNLAIDSLRRRRSRETALVRAAMDAPPAEDSPEGLTALVRRAAAQKALEELGKLPVKERRILLLKVIQDFSLRDIAEIMGMSFGNVAHHLNAGLRQLATRLKEAGVM